MPATAPDPNRLGGLGWTRRTSGTLTRAERRHLLGAIAKGLAETTAGRIKLATGRLPAAARDIDVRDFTPPDSSLARACEEACAELPTAIAGHSYRTWMFGLALAALDRNELDSEFFYCAALLHDHGVAEAIPGQDFTLRSVERMLECASAASLEATDADLIGDAICVHTTPGVTVERDGPLGCYVQWGAMVDGAGLRAWDISPENRDAVIAAHPRGAGFKREFAGLFKAEAAANPDGRFALLARTGVPLAVRLAPYKD